MALKVKSGQIHLAAGAFLKLKQIDKKTGASVVELARLQRWLKPVLAELGEYQKTNSEILQRYSSGPPADLGNGQFRFPIAPESATKFNEEVQALNDLEVELPVELLPEKLYCFADLSVADLDALEPFIVPVKDEGDAAPPAAAPGKPALAPVK
jgi:hypothetical protein